jgi:hypothetical protein
MDLYPNYRTLEEMHELAAVLGTGLKASVACHADESGAVGCLELTRT